MAVTVNGTATNAYSSAVFTITSTMPGSIAVGELLIVHHVIDDGSRLVITDPSGWTQQWRNNRGTSDILQTSNIRVATGSEAGSYDWGIDLGSLASSQAFRISGQHSTYSDATQSTANGSSTTLTATGITTVTDGALALAFFGCSSTSNVPSLPSGWTDISNGNSSSRGWRVCYKEMPAAGAVGDAVSTQGASRAWVASMWAIRPAAAGGSMAILPATRRGGFPGLIVR